MSKFIIGYPLLSTKNPKKWDISLNNLATSTTGYAVFGDNSSNLVSKYLTGVAPTTNNIFQAASFGNVNTYGPTTDVSGANTGTYYSNGVTATRFPADTSNNRPPAPLVGYVRYNINTNFMEFYNGTNWLSISIYQNIISSVGISGNGSVSVLYTDSNGLNPSNAPYSNGYTVVTLNNYGIPGTTSIIGTQNTPATFTLTTLSGFTGNASLLLVGGGGGGGGHQTSDKAGGGGGAGGLIYISSYPLAANYTYTVTVGTGGTPGSSSTNYNLIDNGSSSFYNGYFLGSQGGNTSFNNLLTAYGGGGGGSGAGGGSFGGQNGGSGGGAVGYGSAPPANLFGGFSTQIQTSSGSSGCYGNPGGTLTGTITNSAAGGGGAGAAGGNPPSSTAGGNGGSGLQYSISGTPTYYAGGGGGGSISTTPGTGGTGGGGSASTSTNAAGVNGVNGTGGGGGGGGYNGNSGNTTGGAGGNGIAIIRFPTFVPTIIPAYTPTKTLSITGGSNYTITYTDSTGFYPNNNPIQGGYTIYTFINGNVAGSSALSYTVTPNFTGTANILVAGGGGGAGNSGPGDGGGGGGGVLYIASQSLASGTPVTFSVGSGGTSNNNGGTTTFTATNVPGGGGGGAYTRQSGQNGAAGGGGSGRGGGAPAPQGAPGSGTYASSQNTSGTTAGPFSGGTGNSSYYDGGGGGGGAGGAGQAGGQSTSFASNYGGYGGAGVQFSISGLNVYYGGGGGGGGNGGSAQDGYNIGGVGGGQSAAKGSSGGIGGTALISGSAGINGTGQGGGAGNSNGSISSPTYGSYGAGGTVIIRYLT